jgi:DNA-binding MarR family transcriptional regulator
MTTHLRLEDQICHSLYSATNALVRAYRPLLEPLGLTYPQYLVMLSLWEHDGVGVGALRNHTRLDGGTLTPLLKRLEEKGLVRREHSKEDERRRVITLTDAGRRLRRRAERVPAKLASGIDMAPEDAARLKALCEALHSHLTDPDT